MGVKRKNLEQNTAQLFAQLNKHQVQNILPHIETTGPTVEFTDQDEGEHTHDEAYKNFMNKVHQNPFTSDIPKVEGRNQYKMTPSMAIAVDAINDILDMPENLSETEANNKLFGELGRRVTIIEADLERSGDLKMQEGATPEGFSDIFVDLGKQLFSRVEREIYKILCEDDAENASDRAIIREVISLDDDGLKAVIVGILTTTLGLSSAIAVVATGLIMRLVIKPTTEITCASWKDRLVKGQT